MMCLYGMAVESPKESYGFLFKIRNELITLGFIYIDFAQVDFTNCN
jgi:hypothetical protein